MSWVNDLASFARRLLDLERRVGSNTEELKALRQDLNQLKDFTREVAYAVKRNQDRAGDRHTNLVLNIENQLLRLERKLSASQTKPDPESTTE